MPVTDRLPLLGSEPDLEAFLVRASRWACDLEYHQLPRPVRRAAKAQLTSTVGAAVWTATHPLGGPITTAVGGDDRDDGTATVLAGVTRPPAVSARGNAALSTALAFDDAVLGGATGHSSVFVPLAYAESTGATGERTLVAVVAANEVAGRLGAAAPGSPFAGLQTPFVHAIGAAVGRAVLEGDDAETLADALGTALLQPSWPLDPPSLGSDAAVWSASEAIETGLSALDSARAGLAGEPDVVEADAGFLDTFADPPLEAYLEGFGERWHSRAVTVKGVPARGAVAAPIEAALAVRGRFDPGRTSVKRVDVRASRAAVEAAERVEPYLDGPGTPVAALTSSVAFNVAAALVDGEHTPRQLGERSRNAGIWRLADRVFLHHGPEFTAATLRSEAKTGATPSGGGLAAVGEAAMQLGPWGSLRHVTTLPRAARGGGIPSDLSSTSRRPGARVEVTTTDGRTVAETIEHPSGFAGKPLAEIRAVARNKCRTGLQAAGVREAAARERADELLGIDDDDVVSLAPLLEGASRR